MMKWADEIAYAVASLEYPKASFVTKMFNSFDFKSPVKNGEIVEISGSIDSVHNTSVVVVVSAKNLSNGKEVFKTSAVMVNFDGKKKKLLTM